MQCAINDSLLENGKNLGNTSESFYFSYYKLKLILNSNPGIKKVYLGFSYHSLSDYYDEFIYGKYSGVISPKYFFLLPLNEQAKMIGSNINDIQPFIKSVIITFLNMFSNEYPFSGGYKNKYSDVSAVVSSMDKRLNFQYYNGSDIKNFSSLNLMYLSKIIDLCKESNVQLIFLNTPLHSYYRSRIPAAYIDRYNEFVDSHDLKVIDFSNLDLTDNCFIPDGDHLSMEGAYRTTQDLIK